MKDEKNHHGTVDKSFLEQQICIVDANYIPCEKNWTHTPSGTRTYSRQAGGRQVADGIQVNLEIFKNHCTLKDPRYSHYSSRNAFRVFFR